MENVQRIKKKSAKGLFWNLASGGGAQMLEVVIGIFLARLLFPEEFGLIAMVMVFIAIGNTLREVGLSRALIQKNEATESDFNTVFWINVLISAVLAGALYFAAPLISRFYQTKEVISVAQVLSLAFFLNGLFIVPKALLHRRLDFKKEAGVILSATLLSSTTALYLAWSGAGVKALIAKELLLSGVYVLGYFVASSWFPTGGISKASFESLFEFSRNVTLSNIVRAVTAKLDNLIVGRAFGTDGLGFFNRAKKYSQIPNKTLIRQIGKTLYPVLSRLSDQPKAFKNLYFDYAHFGLLVISPIVLWVLLYAPEGIVLVLTDKWAPTAPLLQILILTCLFQGVSYAGSILMALDQTHLHLRSNSVARTLSVLLLIAAATQNSVLLIAWASLFSVILEVSLMNHYALRAMKSNVLELLKRFQPTLLTITGLGFCLWGLRLAYPPSEALALIIHTFALFLLWIGAMYFLQRPLWNRLQNMIIQSRKKSES